MAKKRKKGRKQRSNPFTAVLRILAVSIFAVFLGWVSGQVGIRLITGSLTAKDNLQQVAKHTYEPPTKSSAHRVSKSPASSQGNNNASSSSPVAPATATQPSSQPAAKPSVQSTKEQSIDTAVDTTSSKTSTTPGAVATPPRSSAQATQEPPVVKTAASLPTKAAAPTPTKTTPTQTTPVKTTVAAPTGTRPQPHVAPNETGKTNESEAVPAMAQPRPLPNNPTIAQPNPISGIWRVKVGRYNTREAADAALAKVRIYVPQAYVVREGEYRIQAGAFGDKVRAVALLNVLVKHDFSAELVMPNS